MRPSGSPVFATFLILALVAGCAESGSAESGAGEVPGEVPVPEDSGQVTEEGIADAGPEAGVLIDVHMTELRLLRPPGFVRSQGQAGIWNVATHNSIRVVEGDQPYAVEKEFYSDPEALAERDLSFSRRRELSVDGFDATLLLGRVLFGGEVWVRSTLVLGDDTGTATVHATWPVDSAEELEALNLEILASVHWDRGRPAEPFAGRGFRIDPPAGLEFVRPYAQLIRYGEVDVDDPIPPDATYLRIEELTDLLRPEDLERFARESLTRPGTINRVEITRAEEVTIGGLPGVELFSDAQTKRGALPVKTYLLVLFDQSHAFHLFGIVGAETAEPGLSAIRSAARSFRLEDYGD